MAALDDHIRDTVSRLLDSLRGQLESTLGAHQEDLVQAAQEEHARRDGEAEDVRARLAAEIEELQRSLDERQSILDDRQRLLDESHRETASAHDEAVAARAETATAREELATVQQEISAARAEIASLSSDLDDARQQLGSTRDDVEAALRDIETSRRDSDAARVEAGRSADELRDARERVAQALRLPDAIRALDASATFGEVLENLALRAGREAGRAAVFLVKGDRLREWRRAGFDLATDAARLDIALSESGPMAEAVRSGEGAPPANRKDAPEFAHSGDARLSAAWPIAVGGSVAAVLYADGPVADTPNEPYWPAFLEVLTRHAGRVLEGITVRHAAGLMTGGAAAVSPALRRQTSGSIQ